MIRRPETSARRGSQRSRTDRRVGSPVEPAGRDPGAKWVLHRVVYRIGLAFFGVLHAGDPKERAIGDIRDKTVPRYRIRSFHYVAK
jgi:hypothetical protein